MGDRLRSDVLYQREADRLGRGSTERKTDALLGLAYSVGQRATLSVSGGCRGLSAEPQLEHPESERLRERSALLPVAETLKEAGKGVEITEIADGAQPGIRIDLERTPQQLAHEPLEAKYVGILGVNGRWGWREGR